MSVPVNLDTEKQRAKELLDELGTMKGPENLTDWNIRAQTLLVFVAIKEECAKDVGE